MSTLTINNAAIQTYPTQKYCYSGSGFVKIQSMIAQEDVGTLYIKMNMVI